MAPSHHHTLPQPTTRSVSGIDSQDFSGFCVVGSSLHSVLDVDPVVVGLTPGHEGFTAIEKMMMSYFTPFSPSHFKGLGGGVVELDHD